MGQFLYMYINTYMYLNNVASNILPGKQHLLRILKMQTSQPDID